MRRVQTLCSRLGLYGEKPEVEKLALASLALAIILRRVQMDIISTLAPMAARVYVELLKDVHNMALGTSQSWPRSAFWRPTVFQKLEVLPIQGPQRSCAIVKLQTWVLLATIVSRAPTAARDNAKVRRRA